MPTVPGDVLVGSAAVLSAFGCGMPASLWLRVGLAAAASVFVYLFGLVDNDLVGAATDRSRPLPDGEISPGAARWARGLCWGAAMVCGALGDLPPLWWMVTFALFVSVCAYNRSGRPVLMGLCRGLNVLCGAAALAAVAFGASDGGATVFGPLADAGCAFRVGVVALVWTVGVAAITWYSEGEELDPSKRANVGRLIAALVYLQLLALLWFRVDALLIAGAVLLVMLRAFKLVFPKVSAS